MTEWRNIYALLQRPEVRTIVRALEWRTQELYIVGGAVRDALAKKNPKDVDFASDVKPDEIKSILDSKGIKNIETGLRRGTITAMVADASGELVPVEITTFRNPKNEKEFSDCIDADLPARDFTINAMALNACTGELYDPFNGAKDLENRIIRTVKYPDIRFKEDPHRILRMIRFAFGQKGWSIDVETLNAASQYAHLLQTVSVERIKDELMKILVCEQPAEAIRAMTSFGIMKFVIPELLPCVGFEQNHYHIYDVYEHILQVVKYSPNRPLLRLAALLHDIAKPDTMTVGEDGIRHFLGHEDVGAEKAEAIMRRLKFSLDDIAHVKKLVQLHMRPVNMGPKGVRRLLMDVGETLQDWLDLKYADYLGGHTQDEDEFFVWLDKLKEQIEFEQNRVDVPKFSVLALNGDDIMSLGFKQGPMVGKILKWLHEMVIEDPALNVKEILIEKLTKESNEFEIALDR